MRSDDTGTYLKFRTNYLGNAEDEPAMGNNRLIAIGTGDFDIDFNNLPSHNIWIEKTSNKLTLCSGQETNAQTIDLGIKNK